MTKILAILLFILWLLGAFGVYSGGWFFHIFLILSIMLFFISMIRNRNLELSEIMSSNDLPEEEAKKVKKIMDKNKLGEKEALELSNMRSSHYFIGNDKLLQTKAEQIRKIMSENGVSEQEAVELLSARLNIQHR